MGTVTDLIAVAAASEGDTRPELHPVEIDEQWLSNGGVMYVVKGTLVVNGVEIENATVTMTDCAEPEVGQPIYLFLATEN